MKSEPPAVAGRPYCSIKVWQVVSLPIHDIVYRLSDIALIPQVSLAAFIYPRTVLRLPVSVPPHLTRGVCFECIEGRVRFLWSNGNNHVYVIGSNADSMQYPGTNVARF